MNNAVLTFSEKSYSLSLNFNSELKDDKGEARDLKNQIISQIVKNSNDQANSFQHLPTSLKFCAFAAFFINSFFANLILNVLISSALLTFAAIRGFNAFNGQGGLLHDIVNFFPYVGKLKKDWIEDDPKRLNTMIFGSIVMLCVVYPAVLYLSNDFLKKAEYFEKYSHLIKSFVMVFQGLFMTLFAVLFGMALNYFVNLILKKKLNEKEYSLMKDQTQYSKPTKVEVITRVLIASLGLAGSIGIKYYTPKILEQISTSNPFYSYVSVLLTAGLIMLGVQCLSTRVLIPMIRKLMLKHAREKEGKGRRKKVSIIILALTFYFSSIALFGLSAYLEKSVLFQNPVIQNLVVASCTGFGISFNILGCMFIFMMTMLLVNSREIATKLLSNDSKEKQEAKSDIKRNKIIGGGLLFCTSAFISIIVGAVIYSEIYNLQYLDLFKSKPYLVIALSLLIPIMIFTGIALYGKSKIIEKNCNIIEKSGGVDQIQKLLDDAVNNRNKREGGFEKSSDHFAKFQLSEIFRIKQSGVDLEVQFS
jgi:hypothetical protein